jgi:hypothetical protein
MSWSVYLVKARMKTLVGVTLPSNNDSPKIRPFHLKILLEESNQTHKMNTEPHSYCHI